MPHRATQFTMSACLHSCNGREAGEAGWLAGWLALGPPRLVRHPAVSSSVDLSFLFILSFRSSGSNRSLGKRGRRARRRPSEGDSPRLGDPRIGGTDDERVSERERERERKNTAPPGASIGYSLKTFSVSVLFLFFFQGRAFSSLAAEETNVNDFLEGTSRKQKEKKRKIPLVYLSSLRIRRMDGRCFFLGLLFFFPRASLEGFRKISDGCGLLPSQSTERELWRHSRLILRLSLFLVL